MRNFPTEKALVAAYWRKLASSVGAAYKSRGRASVRPAAHALRGHQRRTSRPASRVYGAAKSRAAAALGPHPHFDSNL